MSYRFTAENDFVASVAGPFETRDKALAVGRGRWSRIKQKATSAAIVDDAGVCEMVWRRDADPRDIPVGYYAVAGKRYHVSRPESGKWQDWTFVSTGSDYHDRRTIASVRPDGTTARQHRVLTAIAADPFARATEYGQITGTCSVCGRKLEDPDSRRLGLGPICRQKFGM